MKLRDILFTGLRLLALWVVYLVVFVVTASLGTPRDLSSQMGAEQVNAARMALPIVAFLNTCLVAYLVRRSRWSGWQLMLTLFFVFYGVYTFLQQIETLAFPTVANRMPPGLLASLFVTGALFIAILSPLAVLILGKWKKGSDSDQPNERLIMPARKWTWKLVAIVGLYEIVYFTFGYYVAWRTPGLPEFYGGTDPGTFFGQMANVMRDTPWLPVLQVVRALLWTLIALPVVRMLKGSAWETSLALGLLFSVMVAGQLLFPNPFMPEFVARAHQIELASSNFIFGILLTGVLLWRPARKPVPKSSATPTAPRPARH